MEIVKSTARIQNKQAWVETFVYLCPNRVGGDIFYHCSDGCNCTKNCSYINEFFKTYRKIVNKELIVV